MLETCTFENNSRYTPRGYVPSLEPMHGPDENLHCGSRGDGKTHPSQKLCYSRRAKRESKRLWRAVFGRRIGH